MSARPFKTQIHVSKEWTLYTDISDHMTATDLPCAHSKSFQDHLTLLDFQSHLNMPFF